MTSDAAAKRSEGLMYSLPTAAAKQQKSVLMSKNARSGALPPSHRIGAAPEGCRRACDWTQVSRGREDGQVDGRHGHV